MKKVIFNGSILPIAPMVGVPRCLFEIVKEIDCLYEVWKDDFEFQIVYPCKYSMGLAHVKEVVYNPKNRKKNKLSIELWNQFDFVRYKNQIGALAIDVSMEMPFKGNDVTFIHDCQPELFKSSYRTKWYSVVINWYKRFKRRYAAKNSKCIIAVSENTKKEIEKVFHVESDKIHVIYNGWQHFQRIISDENIFAKYPQLNGKEYCFSLGSTYAHKNLKWIISAAQINPELLFVVTGRLDVAKYTNDVLANLPSNIIATGYLSDEEIKALMENCKVFIQPSFCEGFGIPPLEALSVGCRIIVSNTSSLPEIYGDGAYYIDPYDYKNCSIDEILKSKIPCDAKKILDKYQWKDSALKLIKCIESSIIVDVNI